jgi:glutathione S-transferase
MRLYELVVEDGCPISPFVWRVKYALAHKELEFEVSPVSFHEIRKIGGGRFKTVPVVQDGDHWVGDSWAIAEDLDKRFPDLPLFATPAERSLAGFFDHWFTQAVLRRMFGLYVLDIHDRVRPEERDYFRASREAIFRGQTLEAVVAGREERLPALREALQPLRAAVAERPWLSGDEPGYADYIALGGFLWAAGVNTLPPLTLDDPLVAWIERGFDLYGGLGRDPRMRPLAA